MFKRFYSSGAKQTVLMMMGMPGVGKGTYSKLLMRDFKIPMVSTGDEIRNLLKADQYDPKLSQIKNIQKSGKLLGDDLVFEILKSRLEKDDCVSGFILDGFPRTIEQARMLERKRILIDLVVNIFIEEDVVIEKLMGRRVCSSCGDNYNVASIFRGDIEMPPLNPSVEGVCDSCGGKLIIR